MTDLSGFKEVETGYKVRRTAWVVRGWGRGEWTPELREEGPYGSDKNKAMEDRDWWNSTENPVRPHNAEVIEYVIYEKVIHDTVKEK